MIRVEVEFANVDRVVEANVKTQRRLENAVTRAVLATSTGLRQNLARRTGGALGRKIARTWRREKFPRRGESIDAAALVFTRAPEIIEGFATGALIRPLDGKFLLLPTQFNRRRKNSGRFSRKTKQFEGVKVTPAEMAASGASFVRRGRGRIKIWFLRVGARTQVSSKGRKLRRAFANSIRISGRGIRQRDVFQRGAIPMYVLLPAQRLPKRFDTQAIFRRWSDRFPTELKKRLG